jgi:signal transduction histidine kinase
MMARARDGKGKGKPAAGRTRSPRRPAANTNPADTALGVEARLDELSRANRHLKRKIFDLYTIFEISRNFSAVLDYKTLLESFIFTCLGQVGVMRGALFLKEGVNAREYRLAKAKGSGTMPSPESSFPESSRLVSYLNRLNRPILITDLSQELITDREAAIFGYFEGGMIVPLIYKTHLAGLFLLADKMDGGTFTQDEIEFISSLGNQISVAIENARLYEGEKAANEQLWAAQQQLVQAERLATLGEMSAKIAHEVNNPLGIIKNYLLLLKRSAADPTRANEYVTIVSEEIDRIARIVDELRRFHRPFGVEHSVVDVLEVLDATLSLTSRQLNVSGIEVVRRFGEEEFLVKGNSDHLRQVFLNLILNARAAMEKGGRLTVEVIQKEHQIQLRFQDTGPGVPEEIIPKIFEPFFTTKGEQGSGLGLSICQGIIKSHKGSITFRNASPGGCFEIVLPLVVRHKRHDEK